MIVLKIQSNVERLENKCRHILYEYIHCIYCKISDLKICTCN